MGNEEVVISENLLNLFVQTIAEHVSYANAQPVFEQMAFELAQSDKEQEETPQIITS